MNDTSENNETSGNPAEQWAAFQKIWTDTFSKLAQIGFTFTPDSAPPDVLRQIRSGVLQALAQSWDDFLRSPQFLEGTKQWMDSAIAFRKMTNEFLTKARHEGQDLAREDIDSVMLAMRHMETRILDRMEEVCKKVCDLQKQINGAAAGRRAARPTARRPGMKAARKPQAK
jgi:hypothetical protein